MNTYRKLVWLPIAIGVMLALGGAASVIWPGTIIKILPVVLGIFAVLYGAIQIFTAVMWSDIMPVPQRVVGGAAAVVVGLVFLINRTLSVTFIGVVIGILAIVSAIASGVYAYNNRDGSGNFWYSVVNAALKAVIGVIMLLNPFGSMTAIAVLIGAYLICTGVSIIIGTLCCKDTFSIWW